MFEQVVLALLSGEFICPVTGRDGFAYLEDGGNQGAVDDYLSKIGLHLAKTRSGGAYFAAHNSVGGLERKAAKDVFAEIKHTLRPAVAFLDLVMRAMQSDEFLAVGTLLEVNKLMGVIDANPSFRNELQTLAIQLKVPADGTDRTRLDKILKTFRERGYLHLSNSEREIYQITGKIEFIQEAIQFLSDLPEVARDGDDTDDVQQVQQGELV